MNQMAELLREQKATPPTKKSPKEISNGQASITPLDRHKMIEMCAYYKAEKREFPGESALQDWLEAEAEIDGQLNNLQTLMDGGSAVSNAS